MGDCRRAREDWRLGPRRSPGRQRRCALPRPREALRALPRPVGGPALLRPARVRRRTANLLRLDPPPAQTDLELVFGIEGLNRDYLYTSREIVLDCLCRYLPAVRHGGSAVDRRACHTQPLCSHAPPPTCQALAKKDRHMIAAAYMQRMSITAPQTKPTDEAFSHFTLPGTGTQPSRAAPSVASLLGGPALSFVSLLDQRRTPAGSPNVHCKFVQVVPAPSKLDEYAVQIILSRSQLKVRRHHHQG